MHYLARQVRRTQLLDKQMLELFSVPLPLLRHPIPASFFAKFALLFTFCASFSICGLHVNDRSKSHVQSKEEKINNLFVKHPLSVVINVFLKGVLTKFNYLIKFSRRIFLLSQIFLAYSIVNRISVG